MACITGLDDLELRDALDELGQHYGDRLSVGETIELLPSETSRRRRREPAPETLMRRAEELASLAAADPAVIAYRRDVLGGQLVDRAGVSAWVEARRSEGERICYETRDQTGRLIRSERPSLELGGPDGGYAWYVPSTSTIEPLRRLSEHLSRSYGWQEAQATVFVLTGRTPLSSTRVTVRHVFGRDVPERHEVTVSAPLADDPEYLASAVQRVRREHGTTRRGLSAEDERRLSALAKHVGIHGSGEASRLVWNREHPDWTYRQRQSFAKGAERAKRLGEWAPVPETP